MSMININAVRAKNKKKIMKQVIKNWELYLLIFLPMAYIIIFKYWPMYGTQIAFRNYMVTKGISGSKWVGLDHFKRFINSYNFAKMFFNTLEISVYQLVASFPIPILLAVALNYCRNKFYKKAVQMATYAPHFISVVVMVGLVLQMLALRTGIINNIIAALGFER